MVTNMISQLQESFPLRRAAGSFEISFTKSCPLCRNFISIYKINRTLHSRLMIRPLSSRAESIFNSYIHYSILSCFILMVYYRKDSRPRRIFTTVQLISATCAQTLCTHFQSQPIFGPPVNFSDLRSHLSIIHKPLFSRQNKSVTTSLLTNKLYPDLIRARKRRICPSFKCR